MLVRRRFLRGLVVPALLVCLVGVFATLQYRWLGQASEADREQMRRSLAERASQFAADFDRELAVANQMLRAPLDFAEPAGAEVVSQRIAAWQSATRFPGLLRTLYAVQPSGDMPQLFQFNAERRIFEPAQWTAALSEVRARVAIPPRTLARPAGENGAAFLSISVLPVLANHPPAVLIAATASTALTIVELDETVMKETIWPELVRQYFQQDGEDSYRVAVADQGGHVIFSSDPRAAGLRADGADVRAPILRLRPDLLVAGSMAFRGRDTGSPVDRPVVVPAPPPPTVLQMSLERRSGSAVMRTFNVSSRDWTLLLQHPDGSIDAAVTAGRRRNLWLSFGILSILTAGLALVVVNARRAQELAARQMDFVATVSHELRTPVAVMRSAAQNLSAGVVDPADAKRYGDLIESEGQRLTGMVDQVLEFASLGAAVSPRAMQRISSGAVVRQAVDDSRTLLTSAGFAADVDIPDDANGEAGDVMGDPEALRRAVGNLIANAVKHGADGRWVGVSVRTVTVLRDTSEVQIAVSDRGAGVDASDLPRIFEAFYRGRRAIDRQIQGSGLGLSLVQRIVERHGGRVTVRSTPSEGATFTIHLPIAGADRAELSAQVRLKPDTTDQDS